MGSKVAFMRQRILGNEPVGEPLNVQREIRRFRRDPLDPLIARLKANGGALVTHGDLGRYYRAYDFYALSLERVLRHISIGRRFQSGVRPYYGGRRALSERQRAVSRLYREQRGFFELDFENYLLHARILLDRTIGLSRRFLRGANLPSFTSFADHKRFLQQRPASLRGHHAYRRRIANRTAWFDMPLKYVRDKLVVHTPPKHFLFLGYPSHHDLEMMFIPVERGKDDEFSQATCLKFSVRRLARDIEGFLKWYNKYTLAAVEAGQLTSR